MLDFWKPTRAEPYLECPNCGKLVMTLSGRAVRSRAHIFTCQYCGCKYRIPTWCQDVQGSISVLFLAITAILYVKLLRSGIHRLGGIDAIVLFLLSWISVQIMKYIGARLAYVAPLEKVD